MVFPGQRHSDLGGYRITIEVINGGGKTLLSTVRLYGMNVSPSGALDMSRSLHLIIDY